MAAYAALDSLMQLIDDIQHHPSPPISMDKDQVESLTEIVTFLQGFLENYNSSVADDDDKADPLEMRVIEAAYAAEDIIESYIVDVIKLSKSTIIQDAELEWRSTRDKIRSRWTEEEWESNSSKSSSSGWDEEVDPGEEVSSRECRVDASKEEVHQHYSSSVAEDNSEADPLEKFIDNDETSSVAGNTDAAENITESNIVEVNKLSGSTVLDSGEQSKSYFSEENDFGEESSFDGEVTCINLYESLHQVIEEMDLIKKLAIKIDAEKPFVSFKFSPSSSIEQNNSNMMEGSEDVLIRIMEKLFWGHDNSQVIPIVGMGGIGKTTLAKTIYSEPRIKEHFDICAWATISQQYSIRQILCKLLSRKEEHSERSEEELGLELYQYLYGRRFLIVMDDMWDIVAWDKMQRFFPNNGNGSWILVTTRLTQLSSQLNSDYSLQMRFLDESSSWNLFSKIVFGEEGCPLELVEIGKEIVKNCRGLPLSIVVVGGLLKKLEHTQRSWESIRNNLTSVVISENDKHCLRLLKLSYNHLPIYLKPCFLYMGVFEEDCTIRVSRLIKLWIYEGFVKSMNGKSLETTAKGFLKELVDRILILVDRLGFTGRIKCWKIHDLLRDLCLRESRKYGFYHVIGRGIPQGINSERRGVIIKTTSEQKDIDALQSISHNTRSVICEKENSIVKVPWCRNFVLLRILETFSYETYMDFPVFRCVNMRHLNFVFPSMFSLLSSINLMWNLHTLIVARWSAPIGIWEMPQLRHIEFLFRYTLCLPDPPSDGQHVMENLHTLKGVRSFKCCEEVVKRIPNVKKLRLQFYDDDEVIDNCFSNIRCLSKLESLDIYCYYGFREFASLHKLTFPKSLKSLTLWMESEFEWKYVLEEIGSLPFLEKLKMVLGCFEKGKWEIVVGQFPSLKYLELRSCEDLKEWTAQENSMFPRLEHLHLIYLHELEKIPSGIGEIPTLQKIWLELCSEAVVMSAKEIVDEQMELQGDQLSFHVKVHAPFVDETRLAGPNFEFGKVY